MKKMMLGMGCAVQLAFGQFAFADISERLICKTDRKIPTESGSRSVSIIGRVSPSGKLVDLNYMLDQVPNADAEVEVEGVYLSSRMLAISLGIDGVGQVYQIEAKRAGPSKQYIGKLFTAAGVHSVSCIFSQ